MTNAEPTPAAPETASGFDGAAYGVYISAWRTVALLLASGAPPITSTCPVGSATVAAAPTATGSEPAGCHALIPGS